MPLKEVFAPNASTIPLNSSINAQEAVAAQRSSLMNVVAAATTIASPYKPTETAVAEIAEHRNV